MSNVVLGVGESLSVINKNYFKTALRRFNGAIIRQSDCFFVTDYK